MLSRKDLIKKISAKSYRHLGQDPDPDKSRLDLQNYRKLTFLSEAFLAFQGNSNRHRNQCCKSGRCSCGSRSYFSNHLDPFPDPDSDLHKLRFNLEHLQTTKSLAKIISEQQDPDPSKEIRILCGHPDPQHCEEQLGRVLRQDLCSLRNFWFIVVSLTISSVSHQSETTFIRFMFPSNRKAQYIQTPGCGFR
jgi:hypothetical protein